MSWMIPFKWTDLQDVTTHDAEQRTRMEAQMNGSTEDVSCISAQTPKLNPGDAVSLECDNE